MNEENNQEELITDTSFHQWKQHECTVALINIIQESIKLNEEGILTYIKGTKDIDSNYLNFLKGDMNARMEVVSTIGDKDALKISLKPIEEDENV